MRIVDSYSINGGAVFFSVELAEDRFVDVKICPDGGPIYIIQNEDGSTVYSDKAYSDKQVDAFYPGFEYDESAVLDFVREVVLKDNKEYKDETVGVDGVLRDAYGRSGGAGSDKGDKENEFVLE